MAFINLTINQTDTSFTKITVLVKVLPNSFGPSEQYIIDKSIGSVYEVNRNWGIRINGSGER